MFKHLVRLTVAAALAALPAAVSAREVPYWASIRAEKLNMRAGPGRDFPIEWVYLRKGLPVKVLRVHEGWRLVRDPEGEVGWVNASLLTLDRAALVVGEGLAAMRETPSDTARLKWKVERGVVGRLGDCEQGWCKFAVEGRTGFVRADRLWGHGAP